MRVISASAFSFDKRIYFVALILLYFLNTYIFNEVLITKEVYYQTFGEQVAIERIDELFEFRQQWKWMGYVIVPILLLIKMSFTAVCLNIGTLLSGHKIGFKKLFQVAMIAETIFLGAALIKSLWLMLVIQPENLKDIQFFYPLSLMSLLGRESVERYFTYPLQTVNLFEMAYWLALALGLHWVLKKEYNKMLVLVLCSYGIGLLIWMVLVVFMSINLS